MKLAVIIFVGLLMSAQAKESPKMKKENEIWSLGETLYPMERDLKTKALISESCLGKKENCLAYRSLFNETKHTLDSKDRIGGKNPGSLLCKKFFNGEVLVLRDMQENESSFCKFSDGSLLSCSALK